MINKTYALKQAIERVSEPIFNKVLQETKKNHMMVGDGKAVNYRFFYYNPHNFRLYFDFSKENFDVTHFIKTTNRKKEGMVYISCGNIINKNEVSLSNFYGCNIRIKAKSVEVINLINHKENYIINIDVQKNIKKQIDKIVKQKIVECFDILDLFISRFGGFSKFKLLNWVSEDKVIFEDKLNLFPLKMKFNSPIVKKVYNDKSIEFSNSAFACNYASNIALKDFTPEIVNALDGLKSDIDKNNLSKNQKSYVLSGLKELLALAERL